MRQARTPNRWRDSASLAQQERANIVPGLQVCMLQLKVKNWVSGSVVLVGK